MNTTTQPLNITINGNDIDDTNKITTKILSPKKNKNKKKKIYKKKKKRPN